MAALHDVLHTIANLLPHASEGHRDELHDRIKDVPEFVEQLADEQLDDELGEQLADDTTPKEHPTT